MIGTQQSHAVVRNGQLTDYGEQLVYLGDLAERFECRERLVDDQCQVGLHDLRLPDDSLDDQICAQRNQCLEEALKVGWQHLA